MNSASKQQSTADKTLRENPTIDSALPGVGLRSRPHGGDSRSFKVGDFIVEYYGRGPIEFGVVTEASSYDTISVRFPRGEFYSFASHCQHYQDWLRDQP